MSRRATRMPLYEVMRPGARRAGGAAAPMAGDGEPRFGGVVRLPVGVMMLAIAGVLLGLIVAYAAGHARAIAEADRRIEELLLEQRADLDDRMYAATGRSGGDEDAIDPTAPGREPVGAPRIGDPPDREAARAGTPRPGIPTPAAGGAESATDGRQTRETRETRGTRGAGDGLAGPDDAWRRPRVQWWDEYFLDPINTTPGPWYWVLMQTSREGAARFVEFARERGLETYAVPVNNARSASYRVYVVPGLHTNSPDHEWHAPMRAFIKRLGEEWAREPGSGGRTLDDAYLHPFG